MPCPFERLVPNRRWLVWVRRGNCSPFGATQHRKVVKGIALQATRRVLGPGLLTSEGDFHLRQRRLIQPIFHRQRIAGYGESMVQAAAALSARWADGQVLDTHAAMMGLTARLPKFAGFPFGGGPRLCISESFAWMEGVLLIATLAQFWRMHPGPMQRIALQPVITLIYCAGARRAIRCPTTSRPQLRFQPPPTAAL